MIRSTDTLPVQLDVTRKADVEGARRPGRGRPGSPDVMVNNAAIIVDGLVLDTSEEDLDRALAVNFKGVFFGCQAADAPWRSRAPGAIINLASGAIDMPTPTLVCYATAKAVTAQLSRRWRWSSGQGCAPTRSLPDGSTRR